MMDSTGLRRNGLNWELSWIKLNVFEMFNKFEIPNEFEFMKITLKTVLRIFLRTCKTVSRKLCINREDKSKTSQFSY